MMLQWIQNKSLTLRTKRLRDDNLMVHSKLFRPGAKAATNNRNVAATTLDQESTIVFDQEIPCLKLP